MSDTTTDELNILFAGEEYFLENGSAITVSPVPFGKLKLFTKAVNSLLTKISESGGSLENISSMNMGDFFTFAVDEIIELMGLILEKPREWFDQISMSDGVGILEIIIRQNLTESLKKNLLAIISQVSSLLPNQSPTSSDQATPGTV